MDRRTYISLAGAGLTIPIGAFTWKHLTGPEIPDGASVETLFIADPIYNVSAFEDGKNEDGKVESRSGYEKILTGENNALAILNNNQSANEFIQETDFNTSYVLGIEHRTVPSAEFQLEELARDGSKVIVSMKAPREGSSGTHVGKLQSFLIRVTNSDTSVPEKIEVGIKEE